MFNIASYTPTLSLFDLDNYPSSILNLPAAVVTDNGSVIYPPARYNAKDAGSTWKAWGYKYGEDLTLQAGTAPSYNRGSPLLGKRDNSVLGNSGGYWIAGNNTFANIETEDFIIEALVCPYAASDIIFAKRNAGTGYEFGIDGDSKFYVIIDSAEVGNVTVVSAAITLGAWYLVYFFANRGGNGAFYLNGLASGSEVDISTHAGSLSIAEPFAVFADSAGASPFSGQLAYFSIYKQTGGFSGESGLPPLRLSQLTGTYPITAKGTYLPTLQTRASAAYLDKVELNGTRRLYMIGDNFFRPCSRPDISNNIRRGMLIESSSENVITRSESLGATWSQSNLASVSSDGALAPNNKLTADGLVADGTSGTHSIFLRPTLSATTYTLSAWARQGDKDYFCLSFDEENKRAFFNLSTGTISNSNVDAHGIEYYGNGWWRCWVTASISGGLYFIYLYSCEDATLGSWTGDSATVNTWIWGVQLETTSYPSSYIPTEGAAATRGADTLRYKGDDGNVVNSTGGLSYNLLLPSFNLASATVAVSLNDGGDETLRIESGVSVTGDASNLTIKNTTEQANLTGTTDLYSNTLYKIRHSWSTNFANIYVNNISEGNDSSCSIPTSLDRIDLCDYNGTSQINGLISNLKIFGQAFRSGKI